jgi:hypothetical protein
MEAWRKSGVSQAPCSTQRLLKERCAWWANRRAVRQPCWGTWPTYPSRRGYTASSSASRTRTSPSRRVSPHSIGSFLNVAVSGSDHVRSSLCMAEEKEYGMIWKAMVAEWTEKSSRDFPGDIEGSVRNSSQDSVDCGRDSNQVIPNESMKLYRLADMLRIKSRECSFDVIHR